jgi:SecD/SecF fusion protein
MRRLAKTKIKHATFAVRNDGKIDVELPGTVGKQAEAARRIIELNGKLELKKVNLDGFKPGPDGRTFAEQVLAGDAVAPGYKAYAHEYEDSDGKTQREVLLLSNKTAIDSSDVRNAGPNGLDPTKVDITLSSDGEDKMIALTKDMTPLRDRVAILLDGKVMSAPVVISVPLGRQFVIEGMKDAAESRQLAAVLLNPSKYSLKVVEERTVSPGLAKKARGGDKPAAPAPAEGAPKDPTNK